MSLKILKDMKLYASISLSQVHFKEAQEPSDSQEGTSADYKPVDHNANSSSDNGIRKRKETNSHSLNRNNSANDRVRNLKTLTPVSW